MWCPQVQLPWRPLFGIIFFASAVLGVAVEKDAGGGEEALSPVACAISVMLLGSIAFQMMMFYLVNHSDDDIKRYSWQVISATISIFCAVLIFQGWNGIVEEYIIRRLNPEWEVVVDICQLVLWLSAMQYVIAVSSGAVGEPPAGGLEEVELNMKSYAVLFSHTTGFASINAWGSVQQVFLKSSPQHAVLAVPLGYIGLWIFYKCLNATREWIALADDGRIDEFEESWDRETEEAENDVAGLSLSFIGVQALRFHICGTLPDKEGIEPWNELSAHSGRECLTLFVWGLVFGILSVIMMNVKFLFGAICSQGKCGICGMQRGLLSLTGCYMQFANAWCFFYSSKWALASLHFTSENALLHVADALFLSTVSFSLIFSLDKISDNKMLGDGQGAAETVNLIIIGFGILIGFSWEQSFDVAVDVVSQAAKQHMPPCFTKMIMSGFLVLIVFPAWRIHILRTYCELVDESQGTSKSRLKSFASQHYELFIDPKTAEQNLDMAHLKLKEHRRVLIQSEQGSNVPYQRKPTHCQRHLMVTTRGISEIQQGSLFPPRSPGPQSSKEPLLDV